VLFKNLQATQGRHPYITNGTGMASGIVFYRSSQDGGASEGGHRQWANGILYDNITGIDAKGTILLGNRGDMGTGHGWAAAHSTIWQFNGVMVVQKPPTAQNYLISTAGSTRPKPFAPGGAGSIELGGVNQNINSASLYEAQLCDRLKN